MPHTVKTKTWIYLMFKRKKPIFHDEKKSEDFEDFGLRVRVRAVKLH